MLDSPEYLQKGLCVTQTHGINPGSVKASAPGDGVCLTLDEFVQLGGLWGADLLMIFTSVVRWREGLGFAAVVKQELCRIDLFLRSPLVLWHDGRRSGWKDKCPGTLAGLCSLKCTLSKMHPRVSPHLQGWKASLEERPAQQTCINVSFNRKGYTFRKLGLRCRGFFSLTAAQSTFLNACTSHVQGHGLHANPMGWLRPIGIGGEELSVKQVLIMRYLQSLVILCFTFHPATCV